MSGLMGGLIGAGIGGLLFGHGFMGGGLGGFGFLGLLLQIFLVVWIGRMLFRWFIWADGLRRWPAALTSLLAVACRGRTRGRCKAGLPKWRTRRRAADRHQS